MPRASISSKKRMQGADCLAFLKIWWRAFSDSPSHLEKRMGPLMEMKLSPVSPAKGLGHERLAGAGGAGEEDSPGGQDLCRGKKVGVLRRPVHNGDEGLFDLVQPAHVVPFHRGPFGVEFAGGRGFNLPQGRQKIVHCDLQLARNSQASLARVVLPFHGEISPQGHHPGLFAQGLQIGPDKGMGDLGKPVQIHVGARGIRRL